MTPNFSQAFSVELKRDARPVCDTLDPEVVLFHEGRGRVTLSVRASSLDDDVAGLDVVSLLGHLHGCSVWVTAEAGLSP